MNDLYSMPNGDPSIEGYARKLMRRLEAKNMTSGRELAVSTLREVSPAFADELRPQRPALIGRRMAISTPSGKLSSRL